MNTEQYNNSVVDAGDEKIAGLLRSLPVVEAPGDFDVRVRARIAQRGSAKPVSWVPGFVRIAVPAALAVGVGGYYFGIVPSQERASEPAVAQTSMVPQPAAQQTAVQEQPAAAAPSNMQTAKLETKPPVIPSNIAATDKKRPEPKRTPTGGALPDQAAREGEVITAPGQTVASPLKKLMDNGLKLSDGKTVRSAPAGSGLRAGDIIVAVTQTTVTVKRDGKNVQITIK